MRDRRDSVILTLGGALLFCLGLLIGQQGGTVLPAAGAQGNGAFGPEDKVPVNSGGDTSGDNINPALDAGSRRAPGFLNRMYAPTASDSGSNNRFVAITSPVGSGESVLFVLDARLEQLLVYRFVRNKGLEFMAARKIDYDLKINEWNDRSRFTRDEMKRLYSRQLSKVAAQAAKKNK